MKATMVKMISVIALVSVLTGCGSFTKIFGEKILDVVEDDNSITTIKQVGEDEYVFEVEASKEALAKMSGGEEGIKEMTVTMVVDGAHKDEYMNYLSDHTAISF